MLFQIPNVPLCGGERIVKLDLAGGRLFLLGRGLVVSDELVVDKLESADFADLSVDGATVGTMLRFPTLLVDLLADSGASHIIHEGPSQLLKVHTAFGLGQEDSRALLADILEDGDGESNIANVEGG